MTPSRHRPVALLVLALLATAFLVYPYLWRSAPLLTDDTAAYQAVARDLADGKLDALHFRSPGYPLLLVLTGATSAPTRLLFLVSLFLHLVGVGLLVSALSRLHLPSWALIVLAFAMVLPPFVEPTAYVRPDALAGSLLAASLWFLLQPKSPRWTGLAAGLCLGGAALARPSYQLLGVALAVCLALWGSRAKALCLLASFVLLVGGLSTYNLVNFHYFGITPALGLNLTTKTARFIERLPDDEVKALLLENRNRALLDEKDHLGHHYIWRTLGDLRQVTGLGSPELENLMLKLNLELILSAPLEYISEVGHAVAQYWLPNARDLGCFGSRWVQALWAALHFIWIGLFWLQFTAITGSVLTRSLTLTKEDWLAYLSTSTIVFYTMLITCFVDVGEPRQRASTDGIILLLTLLGTHIWVRAAKSGRALRSA